MMSLVPRDTHEGFGKLLQGEQLPLYPKLSSEDMVVELDRWIRNLYVYLRRLMGHFTASNIIQMLVDNHIENYIVSSSGFVKIFEKSYHYHGTNNFTTTIDSSIDWRETGVLSHCRISEQGEAYDEVLHWIDDPEHAVLLKQGSNEHGQYPFTVGRCTNAALDALVIVQVNNAGALELDFSRTGGASKQFYFYVFIGAYSKVVPDGAQQAVGNGL